ncbi:phospholipid scramblase family member 5 [Denticeps clupeoides]|uniref:phospholipid scramblase family member 5 n=1 Tax=Denticeps clupeoides TaxID=299321 RepID=UPI0010A2C4D5|nr:phospholipid scramblase family member 5-like [Denticeps clupeoides]
MATYGVTSQPLPFGRLEREKHIEMLFRAFHRQCGAAADLQVSGVSQARADDPGSENQGVVLCQDQIENGHSEPRDGASEMQVESRFETGSCWLGSGGPGGLELLSTVSQLRITAKPELQGPQCVPRRTYSIANGIGDQLFVAVEESSCLCLQCCGPARSCSLQGFSRRAQQIFLFERPLRADTCCLGCCLMEMRAYTADRKLIGTVHQRWSMFTPYFEVCDSKGSPSVRIQGSCCPLRCLSNQEFQVVSTIGETVGTIWKKWPGFHEECNMDHEYFGLEVPQDIGLKTKVLLLAATFLLNHMFFEMS